MLFYNDNFTKCRKYGESNKIDNNNCQNCKSKLNNRRNFFFNFRFNRNFSHNNVLDKDSDFYYDKLTIEKLDANIRTFNLYNKDKDGILEPRICCICQENISVGIYAYFLSCTHRFHRNCANK